MSNHPTAPLPRFYRCLLRTVVNLVPSAGRKEWLRVWQAEAWHMHDRRRHRLTILLSSVIDLSIGMVCDALWLRENSISGSPALCLVTLACLSMLCALADRAFTGSWHALLLHLNSQIYGGFLFGALPAIFVSLAIAPSGYREQASANKPGSFLGYIKQAAFLSTKLFLALLLGFLLCADVSRPFDSLPHGIAVEMRIYLSALLVSLALRWTIWDQQRRCQHCLFSLAHPARIGRPSHNWLEWNGTERVCRHGHGALHEPEMQTSWCESGRWIELDPTWESLSHT